MNGQSLQNLTLILLFILLSGCSGGGGDGAGGSTNPSQFDFEMPKVSALIIDEDPDSPVAATVMFEEGDHKIERLDFIGPKFSTNNPPTSALIYMKDRNNTFRIDFDSAGQLSAMYLGDTGELRFVFKDRAMNVKYIAPDGTMSTKSFDLVSLEGRQTQQKQSRKKVANAVSSRAESELRRWVEINRAVFIDVTIHSTEGPLPSNFATPSLNSIACWAEEFGEDKINYDCRDVAAQLTESNQAFRTYRLAMSHRASALVPGIEPAVWPSLQACQDALGDDFWVNASVTAGLEISSVTIGEALLPWLKGEMVAAGLAKVSVGVLVLKGMAIAGTTVAANWIGGKVYTVASGTPEDCENIKRRVVAVNAIGLGVQTQEFTNEVHMDETAGWTLDSYNKNILPYRPFSNEMEIVIGDAGGLDRNRLHSIEFIATPIQDDTEAGCIGGIKIHQIINGTWGDSILNPSAQDIANADVSVSGSVNSLMISWKPPLDASYLTVDQTGESREIYGISGELNGKGGRHTFTPPVQYGDYSIENTSGFGQEPTPVLTDVGVFNFYTVEVHSGSHDNGNVRWSETSFSFCQ
jgi:hypothetical protein